MYHPSTQISSTHIKMHTGRSTDHASCKHTFHMTTSAPIKNQSTAVNSALNAKLQLMQPKLCMAAYVNVLHAAKPKGPDMTSTMRSV